MGPAGGPLLPSDIPPRRRTARDSPAPAAARSRPPEVRPVLGPMLLSASRNERVRRLVTTLPTSRNLVERYVAGETPGDAVRVTRGLMTDGLLVTLDHLGEDTRDLGQVERTRD